MRKAVMNMSIARWLTPLLAAIFCNYSFGQWSLEHLSGGLQQGAAASDGEKLYYAAGTFLFGSSDRVEIYDPIHDSWSFLSLNETRLDSVAVVNQGLLFVAGGTGTGPNVGVILDSVEIFNLSTGSVSFDTLPLPVLSAATAAIGDYVFIAGGWTPGGHSRFIQAYHIPSQSWSLVPLESPGRSFMQGVSDERWAAFAGGAAFQFDMDASRALNLFDVQVGVWERLTMPHSHNQAASVIHDGKLYVTGGLGPQDDNAVVDVLDLELRTWSTLQAPSPGGAKQGFAQGPFVVFAAGLLIEPTGFEAGRTADVYNTLTGEWLVTDLSVRAARREVASASVTGIAGVFGGQDLTNGNNVDNVDIFRVNEDLGITYCSPSIPNSLGQSASIRAVGVDIVADNFVTLVGEALPSGPFGFGMFLASDQPGNLGMPGGSLGTLCLGGFARLTSTFQAVEDGHIASTIDLNAIPAPFNQAVMPGDTWYFQAWYRDVVPGIGATSNFTDALQLDFQ